MFNSIFGFQQRTPAAFRGTQTRTAVQNMTPAQLQEQLQSDKKPFVLDVRFPDEYAQGHIAGSRLLPLPNLRQRIEELPKDTPIVCVCRSGNRSMTACEQLAQAGFKELYNLSSGMMGWHRLGLPTA
jgi:rhodanese-related sulfurtransferase